MKKEIIIGLLIVLLLGMGTYYYVNNYNKSQNNSYPTTQNPTASVSSSPLVSPSSQAIILNAQVVATHNVPNNCWIIVSNRIYSVTNYLSIHPGGSDRITPLCGKDATTAFNTKGGNGSHSQSAMEALGALFVGDLGSSTTQQTIINKEKLTPSNPPATEGENEWEDD